MKARLSSNWCLRVLDDHGALAEIPITDKPKCFGRGDDRVDIRLLSTQVSRRHAEILAHPDGSVFLRDFGSTNGTEINGWRISGVRQVHHGDVIRIGRWEFEVFNPAAKPAAKGPGRTPALAVADDGSLAGMSWQNMPEAKRDPFSRRESVLVRAHAEDPECSFAGMGLELPSIEIENIGDATSSSQVMAASIIAPAIPLAMVKADRQEIAALSGLPMQAVADFATDSRAGNSVFGGSKSDLPSLEDSYVGGKVSARAHDLHFVGEGSAPGVCAADLCAVQAFADRQMLVAQAAKRRRLLCEFAVSNAFARNLSAVVAVGAGGKIEVVCGPASSLSEVSLHIEKDLVRKTAEEKRAVVAWDARFGNNQSAVALCCPLSGGEYLYAMTTFENATPAWMALLAQTAFMDRLIRKSWQAIDKYRHPATHKITGAA